MANREKFFQNVYNLMEEHSTCNDQGEDTLLINKVEKEYFEKDFMKLVEEFLEDIINS